MMNTQIIFFPSVTNANNLQRRLDQDGSDEVMTVRGPEASRISKKRAAQKRGLEAEQERTTKN